MAVLLTAAEITRSRSPYFTWQRYVKLKDWLEEIYRELFL